MLKGEKIVVEAKITRERRGANEIGKEIIVDIERYRSHPDARALVVAVYDPDRQIRNPHELAELDREDDDFVVRVVVTR